MDDRQKRTAVGRTSKQTGLFIWNIVVAELFTPPDTVTKNESRQQLRAFLSKVSILLLGSKE